MRKTTFPFGLAAIVAAVTMCLSTAFADNIDWKSAVDGSWGDTNMWNLARTPEDGDKITIGKTGTYTVTMPQSNVVLRPLSFRMSAGNGATVTLDGRGGSFTMPACDADTYVNEPWGVNGSKGHFFNLETYNISGSKKHAVVAMTNAHFTVSCASDDVRFDVWDGFLNFYDPVGVAYTHPFIMAAYNQRDLEIHVHSNAHLRLPNLKFRANATRKNLVAFHGGDSEVKGWLYIPSENFTANLVSTGQIHATDGANISFNGVTIGGTISGQTSSNRTAVISADKGSTITFSSNVSQPTASRFIIDASDGASMDFGAMLEVARGSFTTGEVNVAGASITTHGQFVLGSAHETSLGNLYATNATVTTHDFVVARGTALMKDSNTTISHFYPGYLGGNGSFGEMIFDGGTVNLGVVYCGLNCNGGAVFRNGAKVRASSSEFYIGKDSSSTAEMTIEGDDTEMTATLGNGTQFYVGRNGFGTFHMKGGRLEMSRGMFLGEGGTSTGIVEQTGGDIVINGGDGLLVGHNGYGEYTISSGTITTPQIRLGHEGNASLPTNMLRMTGGFVSVTTTDGAKGVNVSDSVNRKCRLVLEGGILQCHRVRGWTGAKARGGAGWAVLEGDGGTIRAPWGSAGFVEMFDEARLGPKGLTLHSDHAVTISQSFADKEGEAGRLVLAGVGTKTLSGTNSTESVLEVVGGKALFTSTASHHSHVVVTNNATLSFEGAPTGTTFTAFTLGAADSLGLLLMDVTDRIEVESAPEFGVFGLGIAGDSHTMGEYTLISCPGEAPQSAMTAWGKGFMSGGRIEGLSYTFAAAYDSVADRTDFKIVVTEGTGIALTSVWQGPGSNWADDGNWDFPPDASAVATFSSESAPSPVNVAGDQTVGALDFTASKAYSLEGAGSIKMSDNGSPCVSASGGPVSIGVPVDLPAITDFNIVNPAVVAMDGALTHGGLLKTGTGRLELDSASNSFLMGVRVEDGMLSCASFGAFGMGNVGVKQITLAGGTVELREGAVGTMPFALSVVAGAQKAVGFKNDSDVTITSATVTSGDLVKRGAGTLTFNMETATLSTDNGTCSQNGNPSTAQQFFPSNGVMPTAGYCGFNVADGEVVFKGGTYSLPNAIAVGLTTLDVSDVEPAFTVDGATVNTGMGSYHFLLGPNAYRNKSKFLRPRLTVKNGGYLSVNTLNVGKQGDYDLYPEVILDNGTLYASWCHNISERATTHATFTVRNGSKLLSNNQVNWRGPAELTFTDSLFAKNAALDPQSILITSSGAGSGTWLFGENSTFYCSNVQHQRNLNITFAFAGGRWVPTKSGDYNFLFAKSDRMVFETRAAKGLYLAPASGKEWRMAKAITGTGGVVMDGAGTLRFVTQEIIQSEGAETNKIGAAGTSAAISSPYTLDFDGPMDIASGAVVAEEGSVRTNAVFTGAGTLSAVNCPTPKFLLSVDDNYTAARVLTLNGFSTIGGATVDLGRTAENPLRRPFSDIVVAHYTGEAPNVLDWKAVNHGLDMVTGFFRAEGGDVILTLRTSGSVLIFK